ncbi:HvfC family RiPP maturation protein [Methylophaga sp.]|uniref:HvfC family RiPP maturation protein n=1 Tax=Methylophaga sp. TaxID=2024840 RepID=UPI003F696371
MSHTAESFKQTQYAFAAHIRDPENQKAPDNIESRRMAIYRDLFFNNINGTLKNAFPVIRTLFTEEKWLAMVRDFMIKHQCRTPLFVEIAREFIAYLEAERSAQDDPPFLTELAHYEWVELALKIAEPDFYVTPLVETEDRLALSFTQSPLAWLLVYRFPVHQISPDNQPEQAMEPPVCLLVHRNANDEVKFIELNPVSARLLELLDQGKSGYEAVTEIAEAMQHPNPEVVTQGARQMIDDWVNRGILLKQHA